MAKFTYLDGSEWEDDLSLAPRDGTAFEVLRRQTRNLKYPVVTVKFGVANTHYRGSLRNLTVQGSYFRADDRSLLGWRPKG